MTPKLDIMQHRYHPTQAAIPVAATCALQFLPNRLPSSLGIFRLEIPFLIDTHCCLLTILYFSFLADCYLEPLSGPLAYCGPHQQNDDDRQLGRWRADAITSKVSDPNKTINSWKDNDVNRLKNKRSMSVFFSLCASGGRKDPVSASSGITTLFSFHPLKYYSNHRPFSNIKIHPWARFF